MAYRTRSRTRRASYRRSSARNSGYRGSQYRRGRRPSRRRTRGSYRQQPVRVEIALTQQGQNPVAHPKGFVPEAANDNTRKRSKF